MKRLYILFVIVCIISCNKSEYNTSIALDNKDNESISYSDILNYINSSSSNKILTKSNNNISITPIIDIYGDTLFYAVNYYPGWKLLSSDTKLPIELAENSTGSFDINSLDEPTCEWLETMAEEVRAAKESNNSYVQRKNESGELTFPEIWKSIRNPQILLNSGITRDRTDCEYKLYSSISETEVVNEVPHLTSTTWRQWNPYNYYCPFKSGSTSERVPAGCVALSGSQMLYYLHDRLGRPTSGPTQGYCYGEVGNYTQGFSSFSSVAMNNMNNNYAALLIGFVGQSVGMDYDNDRSTADTEDLVGVFESFGISSEYGDYNETIVKNHLLDNMPVIVRADGTKRTILGIPFYSNGHSFIIDGYRQIRHKITNTYVWSWISDDPDSLGTRCYDFDNSYVEVTYTTPYISQIKMNWGWGNVVYSQSYDTWYTLMGNWHTPETDPECDFDYKRKMLYNFQNL